jgi:malate dehydrogenase (oxaloacetate-decarboxylating)(NADP+)
VETGVARKEVKDWDAYRERLERIYGPSREVVRAVIRKARKEVKRIVFPEGTEENILRAAQIALDERIARPILIGDPAEIQARTEELGLDLSGAEIVDPARPAEHYAERLWELRCRKGLMPHEAAARIKTPLMHAVMMTHLGDADGIVCGIARSYAETLGPSLGILRLKEGVRKVAGMYVIVFPERVLFFADATVNIEPTAEDLAEIAMLAGKTVRDYFDVEPRIAMLSFSSFGATRHPESERVRRATEIVKRIEPELRIDGEIQADAALNPEMVAQVFPQSAIKGDANVLIFPDLNSANIAYKLMERLAKAEVIGPIIMGMRKPVSVVNHWSTVDQIVHITAITALAASSTFGLEKEREIRKGAH